MSAQRRGRAQRRAEGRRDAKMVRERERLATLLPGGKPDHPIEVTTASLVEPKARGMPCPICHGSVRVGEHAARVIDDAPLRLVHVACPSCGHSRVVYFRIRTPLPN
jgi:hypothetical protein